jgi:hypothetical protein
LKARRIGETNARKVKERKDGLKRKGEMNLEKRKF